MTLASGSPIDAVLRRLDWMRAERIWPNGMRYLWTDAFGVVLLMSLHRRLGGTRWLDEAKALVAEVERVLGRPRGLRIGEAQDRDGQYFHYLAKWMFALGVLGRVEPAYRQRAIALAKSVHPAFVIPRRGVLWKMEEDLSGPHSGHGFGALDPFSALVVYRLLDEDALAEEIAQVSELVEATYRDLVITQDLGLGMMLWDTHVRPQEPWARVQRERCLAMLDRSWVDPPGYFAREPRLRHVKFAFTNHGVSIGLQAVGAWPERVAKVQRFFETHRSGDEYDRDAITHVMGCCSLLPGEMILGSR